MSIFRVPYQPVRYKGGLDKHLVYYLLEKYFKPGDLIMDPMAGGGTTAIMGSSLGMTVYQNDINWENGWDAVVEWPWSTDTFDGVLLHPPYFKAKVYNDDPRDLGNKKQYLTYLDALGRICGEAIRTTKEKGTIIMIIGDFRKDGKFHLVSSDTYQMMRLRMTLVDMMLWEISATGTPFTSTKHMMQFNWCQIWKNLAP